MKKLSLILAFALLVSLFSACGKVDTSGNDAADAEVVTPSPEPSVEPSEEPTSAPDVDLPDAPNKRDIDSIEAPAVPLDGAGSPAGMVPLKDVPVEYNFEQAIADGCFVNVHTGATHKTHNTTVYKDFIDNSKAGRAGIIRIVHDYCADYGAYIVKDVEFDGKFYIVRQYIREEDTLAEYELVKVYERVNDNLDELFPLYSGPNEAAADGCEVRDEYGTIIHGQGVLEDFYNKVKNGEKALYRRVSFDTTNGNINIALHIEFDGQYFVSKVYDENNKAVISVIYPYMTQSSSMSLSALQTYTYTILACTEKHKYTDLIEKTQEIVKSGFIEAIPHYEYLSSTWDPLPREILDDTDWIPEDESHLSDKAKEYPVQPGTDEWKALDMDGRYASCELTQNEAESMTTRALLETALTYPFIVNIYAFSTLDTGVEQQLGYNLALKEFFTRKNAYYELILLCAKLNSEEFSDTIDTTEPEIKNMYFSPIVSYFERNLLTEENNPWPHLIT